MKKVCIFLLMIFIIGQVQSVYAQSSDIWNNVEEARIGYSSRNLYDEHDIYRGYITDNKNEIKLLAHYLKSLMQIEGGGAPSDADQLTITLKYDSGESKRFDIYRTTLQVIENTNRSAYKFPITKYYQICDFINSLILAKFDKDTEISTEASIWAEPYINKAVADGIIPDWNQIRYKNYIPRVEVCQLIYSLFSAINIEKEVAEDYTYLKEYPFDDTKDISVKELFIKGIISGKSESEFAPYDNITREEFARILSGTYRVIDDKTFDLSELKYNDAQEISDWAKGSVKEVTSLGLMVGDENGNFNPKANITKEEVIVTLLRLWDNV